MALITKEPIIATNFTSNVFPVYIEFNVSQGLVRPSHSADTSSNSTLVSIFNSLGDRVVAYKSIPMFTWHLINLSLVMTTVKNPAW